MCSTSGDPRWDECVICAAVAPDAGSHCAHVRGHGQLYGPGVMRSFSDREQLTRRSVTRRDEPGQTAVQVGKSCSRMYRGVGSALKPLKLGLSSGHDDHVEFGYGGATRAEQNDSMVRDSLPMMVLAPVSAVLCG